MFSCRIGLTINCTYNHIHVAAVQLYGLHDRASESSWRIGNVPVNFLSRHNVNSLQSPPGREETFSIISYRDWPHIFLWGFYFAHRMKISMKFPLAREEISLVITFEDNVNITEEFPLGREETFLGCQHNSKLNSDWILKTLLLQLNQLISNVHTLMSNVDDIRNAKIM